MLAYTKSVTNICSILPKNLTHTFLRFLQVCVIQNACFAVFCKESRIWEGKKLVPTTQLSIFFTMNFVLECILKARTNHSGVSLQSVFLKS